MTNSKRPKGGRKSAWVYFVNGAKFSSLAEAAGVHGVTTMTVHNWCSGGRKSKPRCWKEPVNGQGAPNKSRVNSPESGTDSVLYEDSISYLQAVVRGEAEADQVRVGAARALLPYEMA